MTAKRFQINNNMGFEDKIETFELSCVVDTDNKTFYFIVDDLANVEAFVERLNKLNDENEQLKQQMKKFESQLYCPYDSICIQCNNEYLVQKKEYYVSKCKKGHEQCSKVDVKYCDDFELKGDVE